MFRACVSVTVATALFVVLGCVLGSACGPSPVPATTDEQVLDHDPGAPGTETEATPGLLQVKLYTDTLGTQARSTPPMGQTVPDEVDVRLTPTAYGIAFKRLVLKHVDELTQTVSDEVEIFNAADVSAALVVDLANTSLADLLDVATLPAGTYNKLDIEVFYLDMTLPTIYPGTETHDMPYRMVFEDMGTLMQRDFLLWLEPEWVAGFDPLPELVTVPGWYWMEQPTSQFWAHVVPVEGATAHPDFPVLDLFANDVFWSSEHKVLEGGWINPPLTFDPALGAVVTINVDVANTFDFKDYHDDLVAPDGQWEIRADAGIHPFTPNFECVSTAGADETEQADTGK